MTFLNLKEFYKCEIIYVVTYSQKGRKYNVNAT